MQKIIVAALLVFLILTACATVNNSNEKESNNPPIASAVPDEQQPTPDDARGVTPPAPRLGTLEPADLPLEVVAWGAPTAGSVPPQAQMLEQKLSPDAAAWLESLPGETQAVIPTAAAGEWILVILGGSQPCPAYHIDILSARVEQRSLKVAWRVLPPEPGTGCASVIAYPYLILRLPRAGDYADNIEFLHVQDE